MTPTLGIVFRPQSPPEELRAVVELAERAGVAELWLWEDCFLEGGLTAATAALAWSERLRVGIGLLPVPLRNPALAAMEIATVARIWPDRFVAALGHGIQDWMGQVGARAESPMTLLREHTLAVRDLLDGQTVSRRRAATCGSTGWRWTGPGPPATAPRRSARPEDPRPGGRGRRRRTARLDHRRRRRTPRARRRRRSPGRCGSRRSRPGQRLHRDRPDPGPGRPGRPGRRLGRRARRGRRRHGDRLLHRLPTPTRGR